MLCNISRYVHACGCGRGLINFSGKIRSLVLIATYSCSLFLLCLAFVCLTRFVMLSIQVPVIVANVLVIVFEILLGG